MSHENADSIEQFRRYQVFILRLSNPRMPVSQVANLCGVAYRTVTHYCQNMGDLEEDFCHALRECSHDHETIKSLTFFDCVVYE